MNGRFAQRSCHQGVGLSPGSIGLLPLLLFGRLGARQGGGSSAKCLHNLVMRDGFDLAVSICLSAPKRFLLLCGQDVRFNAEKASLRIDQELRSFFWCERQKRFEEIFGCFRHAAVYHVSRGRTPHPFKSRRSRSEVHLTPVVKLQGPTLAATAWLS